MFCIISLSDCIILPEKRGAKATVKQSGAHENTVYDLPAVPFLGSPLHFLLKYGTIIAGITERGRRFVEYLEGILSFLLGLVAAVFIAIGFALRFLFRLLHYLLLMLTALLIPRLRYTIRMNWLLHDADDGKDSRLRTGIIGTAELTGIETDGLFRKMKQHMQTYQNQKKRRSEIKDTTELKPVFQKIDRLYASFLKQFYLAADTVNWDRIDAARLEKHPGVANMRKAENGMGILLSEHEKTLTNALSQGSGQMSPEEIAQDLEYIQNFNRVQEDNQPEPGQFMQQ